MKFMMFLGRKSKMTKREREEYVKRINKAKERNVYVPEEILSDEKIRGVYGLFKEKDGEKKCFYVGKSNDILNRFIGSSGHVYGFLQGYSRDVAKQIDELTKNGYIVECSILRHVPYDFIKGFDYNANRLCLEELKSLVEKQSLGECEGQLHEAVKEEYDKADWEKESASHLNSAND